MSVGGGDGRSQVVHLLRGIGGRKFSKDHRHDGLLPERAHLLLGRIGKQRGPVLLGFGHGAGERAGFVDGIGVSE